jgi:hypothetical protein
MAAMTAMAACANNGGLGNVLGGILGTPAQAAEVGATVQSVDTRSQVISLSQSNGQALGVSYDSRTKVVYQNQLYPVTSLEYGDQVVARLQDNGNNGYYTDSIYVTQPVNGSATNGTVPTNVQTLQGTVQRIDRNNGSFVVDAGGGAQLVVSLPYRANSADVNRFNSLRVGDYVRFGGVYLNNNRVELRQFY